MCIDKRFKKRVAAEAASPGGALASWKKEQTSFCPSGVAGQGSGVGGAGVTSPTVTLADGRPAVVGVAAITGGPCGDATGLAGTGLSSGVRGFAPMVGPMPMSSSICVLTDNDNLASYASAVSSLPQGARGVTLAAGGEGKSGDGAAVVANPSAADTSAGGPSTGTSGDSGSSKPGIMESTAAGAVCPRPDSGDHEGCEPRAMESAPAGEVCVRGHTTGEANSGDTADAADHESGKGSNPARVGDAGRGPGEPAGTKASVGVLSGSGRGSNGSIGDSAGSVASETKGPAPSVGDAGTGTPSSAEAILSRRRRCPTSIAQVKGSERISHMSLESVVKGNPVRR